MTSRGAEALRRWQGTWEGPGGFCPAKEWHEVRGKTQLALPPALAAPGHPSEQGASSFLHLFNQCSLTLGAVRSVDVHRMGKALVLLGMEGPS